jgi:hypothetical protein
LYADPSGSGSGTLKIDQYNYLHLNSHDPFPSEMNKFEGPVQSFVFIGEDVFYPLPSNSYIPAAEETNSSHPLHSGYRQGRTPPPTSPPYIQAIDEEEHPLPHPRPTFRL